MSIKTEQALSVDVIYTDGAKKNVTFKPAALEFARQFFAPTLAALAGGSGIRHMVQDIPNIVAVTRSDHDVIHQLGMPRNQATFRLGQMDMREAVCDLLRDEAKKVPRPDGFRIYELIDKIEQLEVLHADA